MPRSSTPGPVAQPFTYRCVFSAAQVRQIVDALGQRIDYMQIHREDYTDAEYTAALSALEYLTPCDAHASASRS